MGWGMFTILRLLDSGGLLSQEVLSTLLAFACGFRPTKIMSFFIALVILGGVLVLLIKKMLPWDRFPIPRTATTLVEVQGPCPNYSGRVRRFRKLATQLE